MISSMMNPYYLHTVSMSELYEAQYVGRPFIIRNLLYTGVYLLAGAPKIGKSFLVAQIAYHVSTGRMFWGMNVNQGTVLYLALEDDYRRLQNRMFRMYGLEDANNLYFAIMASKVKNGLEEQLEFFVAEHPDTKLIIIDTLQKTREGSEGYSYGKDYDIISPIKRLAEKHTICVLLVHHTRKESADDVFEMISGTTGLTGSVDGSLLMRKENRTALEATIDVVGRDYQDQIFYIHKDPDTLIWNLIRMETELWRDPPDSILDAVAKLVNPEQPQWTGSPTDLVQTLDLDIASNALSKHLNVKCGKLLEEYEIKYENKAMHAGRRIKLTYIGK